MGATQSGTAYNIIDIKHIATVREEYNFQTKRNRKKKKRHNSQMRLLYECVRGDSGDGIRAYYIHSVVGSREHSNDERPINGANGPIAQRIRGGRG